MDINELRGRLIMDMLYNIDGKFQANKTSLYESESYSNTTIRGTILNKDGKNIRISTNNNELFDIVTKNNLKITKGEILNIRKSEVEMIKKVTDENLEEEKRIEKENIQQLKQNNIKPTDENLDAIEVLKKYGIPITKLSVEKFACIKNLVLDIKDNISIDSLSLLISKNKDIDSMSLTNFSKSLDESFTNPSDIEKSMKYYKISQKISYDKAREIAQKLYGNEMGKDIQDIIISLDCAGIELTRENIDYTHDLFSKLYDIRDIDDKSILNVMDTNQNISINLLYNIKNFVVKSEVSSSAKSLEFSSNTSKLTEEDIENMTKDINQMLGKMGLNIDDYTDITKDLLKNNMEISEDILQNLKQTRDDLQLLQDTLSKDVAAILIKSDVDIQNMDISSLLDTIKSIQNEMLGFDTLNLTKEDMQFGKMFVNVLKNINSNTILSSDKTIGRLLNLSYDGRKLYNHLKGDRDYVLSDNDRYLLKIASVLNSVKSINFDKVDYTRNDISLKYISERNGIIESENHIQNEKSLVKLKYTHNLDISVDDDKVKIQINMHYEYMRSNMRASHVKSLIKDGIDVWGSDVRAIGEFVREEIENTSKVYNTFRNIDEFDINLISTQIMPEKDELNMGKIVKKLDLNNNHNNYFDDLKKILSESKNRNFDQLFDKINKLIKKFDVSREFGRELLREDIHFMYRNLKDIEKTIIQSNREDREIFEKYIKQLTDNIKNSSKYKDNSFVQIPFSMNGESSNANVYARSNNKKSKKINPEDMSVLIDLNTNNLGNMGFYLKVDKKNINLKISGDKNAVGRLRKQISSLSTSLSHIGYNLNMVDLVTPENSAKVAFVEDSTLSRAGNLDVKV